MFETMKKTYLIPETKVRHSALNLTICQPSLSGNPAQPGQPVESKERYEDEDEKGFGHYQW